jgi:hypothetical protein
MLEQEFFNERFQDFVTANGPSVIIFWGTLAASQRLLGSMNYYSSQRWTFVVGLGMVTTCSVMTHHLNSMINEYQYHHQTSPHELRYRSGLTVLTFAILERHAFQTVFPSSVITIGAYAKRKYFPQWARGSVVSTSPTATAPQRFLVNKIGRVHGCHHCGDRQLFGWKKFIADHMPPTKMANEMNQVFWRRWLGLHVKQSLYPQCQSCFQLQGNAVRINRHELIYQMSPRLVHLSPIIAILLSQNQELKTFTCLTVESVTAGVAEWWEDLKKFFSAE